MATNPAESSNDKLKRTLTLFDVYVLCTGAMFSSGFFLLPGLAAAQTGPSVILAYFVSGLMILPAMLSMAELTTAMPRAGGSYYFIDRAMGPLAGTIGGLGTWISLILKSAFALIGMGAYLAIFVELPIKPVAVALTIAFGAINIVGAKESSKLQRILVTILLAVLAYFVTQGLFDVFSVKGGRTVLAELDPFFTDGLGGFASTVGLVFVSYAGLTKVASVAEEVIDPDRSIPLGMTLSVLTATFVYCVGVFIMVVTLEPSQLHSDMTPVATAAEEFFGWIPFGGGIVLIVIAAIAAFASTGNAGIMSASRYPLAMARDRLLPSQFGALGRFSTPTVGIVATCLTMIATIVFLDIASVAKLASAFQLVVFGIINLCVIVMRESKLEYYHPGFRSPFYPWVQLIGILVPIWLIAKMGWIAIIMCGAVILIGFIWYAKYAVHRVSRHGAIYHVFERLGRKRDDAVDRELRGVMGEKGLSDEDPFESVVAHAEVIDIRSECSFNDVARQVAHVIDPKLDLTEDELVEALMNEARTGLLPMAEGIAAPTLQDPTINHFEMVLVRAHKGVRLSMERSHGDFVLEKPIYAFVFLLSPRAEMGTHLRILSHLANYTDEPDFLDNWLHAADADTLRDLLLRDERFLHFVVHPHGPSAELVGASLREIGLPHGVLVALVRREDETFVPDASTTFQLRDRITIIGNPEGMLDVRDRFDENAPPRLIE